MHPRTVPALAGLAMALALTITASGAASTPLPGNKFQTDVRQLFLDSATGNAGKLLSPQAPAAQAMSNFVAPNIHLLGLVDTPSTDAWTTGAPWDRDTEVVDATQAVLYFSANVQALTVFQVRLLDVAPDRQQHLVAQDDQQFVTALNPVPVTFDLHAQGVVLLKGHTLKLEVFAQTANVLVVLSYGGATPSGVHDLRVRWLDTDGDGVADSDEVLSGSNPLDPSDQRLSGKDTDGDGLADIFETSIHTDPNVVDTDHDGFGDGIEVHAGSNPLSKPSVPYDKDGNQLPDVFEARYFNRTTINQAGGIDPRGDPDGDHCDNLCEAAHGTDPTNRDTDEDGTWDFDEIAAGTNPLNAHSPPTSGSILHGVPEPVASSAFFATGTSIALIALLRRP
ncbi:MAG: large repetitive protein [Thermoplasmata archaeon]|jgi:hypothetical protein|nr:large repetitive protein [Thermoplasmata archaeon]